MSIRQANLENCGPPPGNKFHLEVGQRSRSRHGVNWKGLSQWSCMPNINALSLILQKIWARLTFLWRTEGRTDRRMRFNVPAFAKDEAQKCKRIKTLQEVIKSLLITCVIKGLPTTSEDLSVFVLFLIIIIFFIKVSDFSRKPFCFRFVFYSLFFYFFLVQLHCSAISPSNLYGFTSNFQDMIIMTRQCTVWILRRIPKGVGTGRGPKV